MAQSVSNCNMLISTVLVDLYKKGSLKAKAWKNIEVPSKYTEKQSLKNMLELSDEWLESSAQEIEKKCMDKMLQYEGIDAEIEARGKKHSKKILLCLHI